MSPRSSTKKKSTARTKKRPAKRAAKAPDESSFGEYLRRQRNLANKSLRKVAEQAGISSSMLSDIESGIRQPSRAILGSLAGALRLSAETLHLQAGVLDPRDADESSVVREIERDPHITSRQAEILIEVYRTFRLVGEDE